jgi:hypothetical protein
MMQSRRVRTILDGSGRSQLPTVHSAGFLISGPGWEARSTAADEEPTGPPAGSLPKTLLQQN